MHINGYLGPNILNPLWEDGPHTELVEGDLAEYDHFARTGDCYEALFAITRRLLLTPVPRSMQRESDLWTHGPRVNLDPRFSIEASEGKTERAVLDHEAPMRLQALDGQNDDRPVVAFHVYPKHALENRNPAGEIKELAVILPEAAIGLSIDIQAALKEFETGA